MHSAGANRDSRNSFMSPLEQNAKGDGETVKEEGLEAHKKRELANACKKQGPLNYFCLSPAVLRKCIVRPTWESSLQSNVGIEHSSTTLTPSPYRHEFTPVLLTPCNRARIEAPVSHAYIQYFKGILRVKASEH